MKKSVLALSSLLFVLSANASEFSYLANEFVHKTLDAVEHRMSEKVQTSSNGNYAPDVYSKAQLSQSFDACVSSFPTRTMPSDIQQSFSYDMRPTPLCSDGFAVLYSKTSKTPLVVVEKLNSGIVADAKGEKRTDEFFADPRLKQGERAELDDYKGSGYDRGHNAPAADAVDQHAMAQTFALSNIFPQNSENNRKLWSKIEGDTRKYAQRAKGDVFVFTGPIFAKTKNQTIGANKVWVPTHLYKVVYDATSHKAWAFLYENNDNPTSLAPISYNDFAKATGLYLLGNLAID